MTKSYNYSPEFPRVDNPFNSWTRLKSVNEDTGETSDRWEENSRPDYNPSYFDSLIDIMVRQQLLRNQNRYNLSVVSAQKDEENIKRRLDEFRANVSNTPEKAHAIVIPYYNQKNATSEQSKNKKTNEFGAVMLIANPDFPGKVTAVYISNRDADPKAENWPAELSPKSIKALFPNTKKDDIVAAPLTRVKTEETGAAVIYLLQQLSSTREKNKDDKIVPMNLLLSKPKELQTRLCEFLNEVEDFDIVRKNHFNLFETLLRGGNTERSSSAKQKSQDTALSADGKTLSPANKNKSTTQENNSTTQTTTVAITPETQAMLDEIKRLEEDNKKRQEEIKKIEDTPIDIKKRLTIAGAAALGALILFLVVSTVAVALPMVFVVGALALATPSAMDYWQKHVHEQQIEKNTNQIETLKENINQLQLSQAAPQQTLEDPLVQLGRLSPSTSPTAAKRNGHAAAAA